MEDIPKKTNKYANAKIYTIRSHQTDKYYIGSTCESLSKRLYLHRSNKKKFENGTYNYVSSNDILQYDDNYIELLELFPCSSKIELTMREGQLIRLHKNNLVNIRIDGRTLKEHYNDNIEAIKIFRSKKYKCVCSPTGKYTAANKTKHLKTKRHINYLNTLN